MNTHPLIPLALGLSAVMTATASAASLNLNGEVNTAADWSDSNLPTTANPGTINNDGTYTGHGSWGAGATISQTGGTISAALNNEFQNLNYTLSGGTLDGNAGWRSSTGSLFTIAGGTVNGLVVGAKSSGSLNMTSGVVNLTTGGQFLNDDDSTMSLTGGTINGALGNTAVRFRSTETAQLGGTAVLDFNRSFIENLNIATDWTGSFTTAKFDNTDAAAGSWLAEFTSGDITFNGSVIDEATFNANFAVSGDFKTLTLVPEPSSYALLAGLLGLSFVMVRRRG